MVTSGKKLYFAEQMRLLYNYIHIRFLNFLVAIFMLLITTGGYAQRYYFYNSGYFEPTWVLDASLNIGGMNALTDIGGNKSSKDGLSAVTLKNTHLTGGLSLTATYDDWLAFRFDVSAGRVEAHDSLLKGATESNAIGRLDRNLNFRSPITEAFLGVEIHPLLIKNYGLTDAEPPRLSPFFMVGIGVMSYNPQAWVDNRWVELRPLRLEGQGFIEYPDRQPYSSTAFTLPLALGLRYELSRALYVRGEIIRRVTNTDYLDDVSQGDWVDPSLFYKYLPVGQANLASRLYNRSVTVNPPRNTRPRGDSKNNDTYFSFQVRLSLVLNRGRR